ncbi:Prephenate dehydrogenase [Streptococcus parasanguinis]|uniref:prephenate dehydrogenase n=1 Tax=Streptococcus parasanguinis TaxID=1318 RepID=UPI000776EA4C|nr:prephenate dehydrogenase [Streptococcus parasanguinis]KXT87710.1 Prephenate dehydrogenase [Streptococcus parasanguinis]
MEKKVVYIAGLGLIGASLALGIKRAHPNVTILGYNRSESSRTIALERGMVDQVTDDFAAFAPLADIIILALLIKQTKSYLETLAGLNLKDQVLVTDAGSTKAAIVAQAEKVFKDKAVRFVGGHPMAGSHKTGAAAADATFLVEQAVAYGEEHEMTRRFAAGGFRDMTRIAESEAGMWTSILLSNPQAILERIADFKERLDQVAETIQADNEEAIWSFFHEGRKHRKEMQIHQRAGRDSAYDLFIDVPDQEGVILEILQLLQGISLVNIHINEENREDIHGILQLTFKNVEDQERAQTLISQATSYTVLAR